MTDPLFVYASKVAPEAPKLLRIFGLHKNDGDGAIAHDAFTECKGAAEKGSPFAMCLCSRLCLSGWGTQRSLESAFHWAKRAADAGYAPGHYELGKCYEQGIGVSKDLDVARKEYEMAIEGGFAFAACHLAELYHSTSFGEPDFATAIRYAKRGYELGDPLAPYLVATWFEEGDGVIRNEKEAAVWYERASELGNYFASSRLCRAYRLGQLGLAKDSSLAKEYEQKCDSSLREAESDQSTK